MYKPKKDKSGMQQMMIEGMKLKKQTQQTG